MARKAENLVVTDLQIEIANALQRLGQFDKAAAGADKRLSNLVKTANAAEKALNKLGGKGVKVNIEADTSAISSAETDIKALDNLSPKIDVQVNVDEEQAQTELKSLEAPSLKVDVSVDEQSVQTELNSLDAPDINVPVNTDVTAAQTIINSMTAPKLKAGVEADTSKAKADINSIPVPDLKAEVKGDTSAIEKKLEDLKNLAKIDLVFTVADTGLNVAKNVTGLPIISAVNDTAQAVRDFEAQTNQTLPGLGDMIDDVFGAGNWGASRGEVAGVIADIQKLGEANDDLAGAATSAFEAAQVTGEDLTKVIKVQTQLVRSGLAGSYDEAADIIVNGYQRGLNASGDFLDVLDEYSVNFADAGMSAEESLALIEQSLDNATFVADKAGDAIKEYGLLLTTALATKSGPGFVALERYDMVDEAEAVAAGEMSATEFLQGLNTRLNADLASGKIDISQARQTLVEIFGTPAEDLGVDTLLGFDFTDIPPIVEGVATEAAALMNQNLPSAFQNLGRVLENSVIDKLRAAGVDINQFLTDATNKLYEISALISSGVDLPDALAIALQAPELANTIRHFESFFGNVVIELLNGFAFVVSKIPGAGDTATAVRGTIADLGARQLAFDLQLTDDGAEIANLVERATSRGVDQAAANEATTQAIQDMIARGNIAGAQDVVDKLNATEPVTVTFEASGGQTGDFSEMVTVPVDIKPDASPEAIEAAATQARDTWLAANDKVRVLGLFNSPLDITVTPTVDTTEAETAITTTVDGLKEQFQTALDTGDLDAAQFAADQIAEIPGAFDEALNAGNFDLAEAIGDSLGDGELSAMVGELRDEAGETTSKFGELKEQVAALKAFGLTPLGNALKDGVGLLLGLTTDGIEPTSEALGLLADDTTAYGEDLAGMLATALVSWTDYVDRVNALKLVPPGGIAPGVITTDGSGTTPTVITTSTVPGTEGFDTNADGGVIMPGRKSWVGEDGPELISAGATMSVLNNVSSEALFAGVQAALHGNFGGSSTVINNYNNIALNNTNNNAAQRMGSDIRFLNRVRGSL